MLYEAWLRLDAGNAGIAGSLSNGLGDSFLDAGIEGVRNDVVLVELLVGDQVGQSQRSSDLHFLVDVAGANVESAAEQIAAAEKFKAEL